MSFSHRSLPIHAVQYHPESIITTQGRAIIENFVSSVNEE
jgi:anthranilate/para-aminobenzoate synthase component II